MKKRSFIKLLALMLALVMTALSVTGCYGNVTDTVVSADYEAPPEVNTERVKRLAGGYWPAPPGFGGNLSGAQVGDPGNYIYESMFLVIVGTDKIIPRLAEEWTHEGKVTTIKLVQNRTWNDGTKFTAKDLYTYYMINIQDAAINRHLEAINVKDDYTLEFVWAEPVVSDTQKMLFLAEGWQASTPFHIFGEFVDDVEAIMAAAEPYTGARDKRPAFGLNFTKEQKTELKKIFNDFKNVDMEMPVGTGPYMVDKVTNVQCDLKVNPYFPDGDKLEFQKLEMHNVADYTSLLSTAGTDSFIGTLPYDVAENILKSSGTMVMYPLLEQKSVGVIFNTNKAPLNDVRVRKALNEVIDRSKVRKIANYWAVDNDVATTGLIPSTLEKYVNADVLEKIDRYTGSTDKAAQMMEEAGWTRDSKGQWQDADGNTYSLVIAANAGWGPQGITGADEIAKQLTAFGFETEARAVEATVVVSNMKEGLYDMLYDYLDMTWNISDPYKAFSAYYGDITEKAGIKVSETPLILKDYEGKEINMKEATDSLLYINDEAEYRDLVGRMVWATNDNAIAINLYQNIMAIWENAATSKGLPMEDLFEEYNRMMPLPRNEEEYEDIAVLNRAYAPFAEVFIRNKVKPK